FNVDADIPANIRTNNHRPIVRQGRRALRRANPAVENRAVFKSLSFHYDLSRGPSRTISGRPHLPITRGHPLTVSILFRIGSFRSPSWAGCPPRDVPLPTAHIMRPFTPAHHRQKH